MSAGELSVIRAILTAIQPHLEHLWGCGPTSFSFVCHDVLSNLDQYETLEDVSSEELLMITDLLKLLDPRDFSTDPREKNGGKLPWDLCPVDVTVYWNLRSDIRKLLEEDCLADGHDDVVDEAETTDGYGNKWIDDDGLRYLKAYLESVKPHLAGIDCKSPTLEMLCDDILERIPECDTLADMSSGELHSILTLVKLVDDRDDPTTDLEDSELSWDWCGMGPLEYWNMRDEIKFALEKKNE